MKSLFKLIGIIATAMIIGLSMVACSSNDSDEGGSEVSTISSLNGKWSNPEDEEELTLNNGNFEVSFEGTKAMKGTYTTNGNNITITITNVWGDLLGIPGLDSKWYSKDELGDFFADLGLPTDFINENLDGIFISSTATYSISGNTLTITDEEEGPTTYTKIS